MHFSLAFFYLYLNISVILLILFFQILPFGNANDCGTFGWILFQGNCYKLFTGHMNFTNANKVCKEANAEMVSIHSAYENQFVFKIVEPEMRVGQQLCRRDAKDVLEKSFWIGYKRVRDNGTGKYRCSWTDGSTMDSWADASDPVNKATSPKMPWGQGQPSGTVSWEPNSTPTDCIHMLLANQELLGSQAEDGQWNAFECWRELCGVICKKKMSRGQN